VLAAASFRLVLLRRTPATRAGKAPTSRHPDEPRQEHAALLRVFLIVKYGDDA
jgi:hypothetical protein